MKTYSVNMIIQRAVLAACILLFTTAGFAEHLSGTPGSAAGDRWQSSWLELKRAGSFKKGEKIRIQVQGSAENVVVRLLPADSHPSSSDGIEGEVRKVPADKILEVKLGGDHPNVRQISVHAGREAFEIPLGGNNGTVKVVSIERDTQ